MNKLVRSNLVKGLLSKSFENEHSCVACLKRKQHKASSRTMLADAKLPITFWAEAVNTACYVQNRVLVTKPHNKTPYELFNERLPAIGFLRPFGCHVMILNTLDHLGKFDAKGYEGYFVGYSLSSKAFRVFNKRTKKIKENLHVDFLENKSIEKGTGPNWLFDIDTLTNSMNYVPVVIAGTFSTNISGKKEDVHQAEQQEVNGDKEVHDNNQNSNPTASSKVSTNDSFELASGSTVKTEVPTVSSHVPTDSLSVPPVTSSVLKIIFRGGSSFQEPLSLGNAVSFENWLEDFFRDTSNAVSLNEVEADLSNMETAIQVSPTPTLRIQKDHPKSQIIGPVDTPVQTIHKTKDVLKNKKDERGIVIRNKARLVAQGHTQAEVIDYEEVFALVARIEAIRLFLAYASYMGFTVYQMDVKSAFLHGTIDKERIFRYLKGNPKLGLWYPKESPFDLVAYSDSDYGGANQDRKSTTRGCQFLGRRVETMDAETKILAQVNGRKRTVSASSIKRHLKLNNEEDETAFPSGDVRYREAFPTDTSLDEGQDRENIAKTSAMPHEALPRVTSLGGGEGQRKCWKIIRVGNHAEVYQVFEDMLRKFDIEDLDKLWSLVKETCSITEESLLGLILYRTPWPIKGVLSVQDTLITAAEATKVTIEVPKSRKRREAQTRRNMIVYLKNMAGYKMNYFKGMSYDEIRPLFEKHYNYNQAFLNEVNEGIKVPKKEVRQEKEVEVESSKREDDDDDVYADATPLTSMILIVDYKIYIKRNIPYFKIIRADGNHKERFEKTEPKNYTDDYLLNTLKIMFEKPNVKASVWKEQKGKYGLAKMYPLIHFTLEQMVNDVRLKVEYDSEMSLELLRLVKRQLNEGYVP
nr:retrovirus-related Pol polyprotein from transposon TNT 1-94 [Tanacetum cinerariifolium]